jgi:hypothetical protein
VVVRVARLLTSSLPCLLPQKWIDAGILLGIQFGNATLGWYETTKAAGK